MYSIHHYRVAEKCFAFKSCLYLIHNSDFLPWGHNLNHLFAHFVVVLNAETLSYIYTWLCDQINIKRNVIQYQSVMITTKMKQR